MYTLAFICPAMTLLFFGEKKKKKIKDTQVLTKHLKHCNYLVNITTEQGFKE